MKRFDLIWKTETCHANRNYKNCFASLIRLQRHTQYGNGNNIMAGVDVMSIGGGWFAHGQAHKEMLGGGANFI